MAATGRFHDLDKGEEITQAAIRENGDEIAFDIKHSDGYLYSVVLKRNNGSIYQGRAVSQPGSEVADLTCRVLFDRDDGLILIFGSKWSMPGQENYRWQAELQIE